MHSNLVAGDQLDELNQNLCSDRQSNDRFMNARQYSIHWRNVSARQIEFISSCGSFALILLWMGRISVHQFIPQFNRSVPQDKQPKFKGNTSLQGNVHWPRRVVGWKRLNDFVDFGHLFWNEDFSAARSLCSWIWSGVNRISIGLGSETGTGSCDGRCHFSPTISAINCVSSRMPKNQEEITDLIHQHDCQKISYLPLGEKWLELFSNKSSWVLCQKK